MAATTKLIHVTDKYRVSILYMQHKNDFNDGTESIQFQGCIQCILQIHCVDFISCSPLILCILQTSNDEEKRNGNQFRLLE